MKNKFKKYYISHHVITLKRFVIRLIRYLHNIKHFYICKIYFKYYLIKPKIKPCKETHKKTQIKAHKKAHKKAHTTGYMSMT